MRGTCTEINKTSIKISGEKIALPPKPDIQMDICNYRANNIAKVNDILEDPWCWGEYSYKQSAIFFE